MMSLRTVLLAAALTSTVAVLPAAAQADAPWSAPAALEGSTTPSTGPLGTITARGTAALTRSNPSSQTAPAAHPTQLVRTDATGKVLASDGLTFVAQHTATYGATGIAIAGETFGTAYPGTLDDTSTLVVSTMSGTGAIKSTTISGLRGYGVSALAGDSHGNLALVAFNTRQRLVYLRKKGSSTFTKVLTVNVSSQGRGSTVALGGRSGGEVLVAYEDRHTLYARHRGTKSWGSVHQLGDSIQSDISAAFDGSGRESVAWKSQRVNEGESSAPAVISFITAAPGKAFGTRRTIETVYGPSINGNNMASPAVLLRVVDDTHTLLTWTGAIEFDFASDVEYELAVKAQTITSGHTGPHVRLSADDAPRFVTDKVLADAAVAPSGAALVLWRTSTKAAIYTDPAPAPQVVAAYRPAGATAFGAAEPVSAPAELQPQVAGLVDPASGRAVAAWAPLSGPVQFATRPAN